MMRELASHFICYSLGVRTRDSICVYKGWLEALCLKHNVISRNIVSDLSDHFPIFSLAKQALVGGGEHHDPVPFKYRVHNEFTLNLLYSRIANTNFDSVFNSHDNNVAKSQFYDILYDIYDTCCPIRIKTLSSKDIQKPWITRDILNSIKRRNNLFFLHRNGKVSREAYNRIMLRDGFVVPG